MFSTKPAFAGLATICLALTVGGLSSAFGQESAAGRQMKKAEVEALYEGNTWMWSEGSGYFGPKGEFWAVSGDGNKQYRVNGSWNVSDRGRMCFAGTWRPKGKSRGKYEKTCFSHRVEDERILQKREPNGEWYTFRGASQAQGKDQVLVVGNLTGLKF